MRPDAPPDAAAVRAFLAQARRRQSWNAALEGAAFGLAAALVLLLVVALAGVRVPLAAQMGGGILLGALAAALRVPALWRARDHIAQNIEQRAPQCRNLLITAAELLEQPTRVRPYIGEQVFAHATRMVASLDARLLFPALRPLTALAASLLLFAITLTVIAARPPAPRVSTKAATSSAEISSLEVVVTPPAYTGRTAETLRDPARIEALAGSRIRVVVRAAAAAIAMETLGGRQALTAENDQSFAGELTADADGYIAIEPTASDGRTGVRRLIGLTVPSDAPPRVRITAPARDLFLPDAQRTIALALEADDDLALATLRLRYTKVSGSGERFTFVDGELPLQLTRSDGRNWKASAALRLPALQLIPGDLIVYRGEATDRRPGGAATQSDSYIVEITAPGAVAADGFALDDEEDRYGISQQMVILKTERLIARAGSLVPDSLSVAARTIAAEQRSVRAEFVFMMGGELAEDILAEASMEDLDETAHAEADDEAIAGRLANRGRLDLLRAIRSMSRANAALNAADLNRALTEEKAALAALERAFSRTRFILRALTQRERLDLARRLSGTMDNAASDARPEVQTESAARLNVLRRAIAGSATLAGSSALPPDAAARAASLAEAVLQVDPSAALLQEAATALSNAAAALARRQTAQARVLLERATVALSRALRNDLQAAPTGAQPLELERMEGALIDALRRSGPR